MCKNTTESNYYGYSLLSAQSKFNKCTDHISCILHTLPLPVGAAGSSFLGSCVVATSIAVILAVTAAAATAAAVGILLGQVGKMFASGGVTH